MGWNPARSLCAGANVLKNRVRQAAELHGGGQEWVCKVCGIHLNPQISCPRDPRFPEPLKSNITWNPHRTLDTSFPCPQRPRSVPSKRTCPWGTPRLPLQHSPHLCPLYMGRARDSWCLWGYQASDVPSGIAGVCLKIHALCLSLPPLTPSHPTSS